MSSLNPDDLFEYYRDTFLPAYSDVVGFTAKKHIQFLIEMENTLAHIAQYYNPGLNPRMREENLKKAYDDLTRATLDCYKVLWVEMNTELRSIYLDKRKRAFALNISEDEFIKGYNNFREKAQSARIAEQDSIGANPLTAVEIYKEAVAVGTELINSVDGIKLQELNRFRKLVFVKETGIAFIIGFFSGAAASAFWGYNTASDYLKSIFGK